VGLLKIESRGIKNVSGGCTPERGSERVNERAQRGAACVGVGRRARERTIP
jgi:hypothetical protein